MELNTRRILVMVKLHSGTEINVCRKEFSITQSSIYLVTTLFYECFRINTNIRQKSIAMIHQGEGTVMIYALKAAHSEIRLLQRGQNAEFMKFYELGNGKIKYISGACCWEPCRSVSPNCPEMRGLFIVALNARA